MVSRETVENFHRPKTRRLINLSNEEVKTLFEMRSQAVSECFKKHPGFWDNDKILYWNAFMPIMDDLYEIMLEIQSRYPKEHVYEYKRLLPVIEPKEIEN